MKDTEIFAEGPFSSFEDPNEGDDPHPRPPILLTLQQWLKGTGQRGVAG